MIHGYIFPCFCEFFSSYFHLYLSIQFRAKHWNICGASHQLKQFLRNYFREKFSLVRAIFKMSGSYLQVLKWKTGNISCIIVFQEGGIGTCCQSINPWQSRISPWKQFLTATNWYFREDFRRSPFYNREPERACKLFENSLRY